MLKSHRYIVYETKQVSQDMTSWINSWKVNKSCKDNVKTVESQSIESEVIAEECANLFVERSSELRYTHFIETLARRLREGI